MTIDYSAWSDAELRDTLSLPEGREGLRYYLSKNAKVEYLTTDSDEVKADLLEEARARQLEHHRYLKRRRTDGSPDRQVLIEEKMGGQVWRYVGETVSAGFKDDVTGRRAKNAHVVENVASGQRLRLVRATLIDAHDRLGIIVGWPAPKLRTAAPEAAKEGLVTAAHLPSNVTSLRSSE